MNRNHSLSDAAPAASTGVSAVTRFAVALALAIVSLLTVAASDTGTAAAARSWHVAPWGDDAANGTWETPHRTIQHAVNAARSGDTVVVAGGTYEESVQVYSKTVHIESRSGQRAILDGDDRLPWGVYLNRAHGSSLTNITVRDYATPDRNMAAIRAYSNDIVVAGVHATGNHRIGLSAMGSNIAVRDGRFVGNGHLGVHGHRLWGFSIERSAVRNNNTRGYDPTHSAGGMKFTESLGLRIDRNDVSGNAGPGIWTDIDTVFVSVSQNLVEGNQRAGIEIELSSYVNVLSNVTLDNGEAGIWILESQHANVLNNASFGNQNAIEVEEGPRRDVQRVRIEGNTMGAAVSGSRALLDVNDWTENRSAAQMGVTVDRNAYWIPSNSGTANLSRWGVWPEYPVNSRSLTKHRSTTGAGPESLFSRADSNPYVRSAATFDYRVPASVGSGASLPAGAAGALGVAPASPVAIGPVAPVVRR